MPDLHDLPANVQLQIYDLFLALQTYKRQRRLETVCGIIKEGNYQNNYYPDGVIIISGADEIDVDNNEELRDSLPGVILRGYNLINLVWGDIMHFGSAKLSRCSFSLDDGEADIQVLRLILENGFGWRWDAIYDIHTFKCLVHISGDIDVTDFENNDIVEAMRNSLEECADYVLENEEDDEQIENYSQWLKEVSEKNYATSTFSDEFIEMRSLLHERFSSRL